MSETWDEEALRILKRRARTHELLVFVTWLEDHNDEGNFGQIGQVAEGGVTLMMKVLTSNWPTAPVFLRTNTQEGRCDLR